MSEDKTGIKLLSVSGETNFPNMTSDIEESMYLHIKALAWLVMIDDNKAPTMFHKPTKKGTRVAWTSILTAEDQKRALAKLKGFIAEANDLYPELELRLEKDKEEPDNGHC